MAITQGILLLFGFKKIQLILEKVYIFCKLNVGLCKLNIWSH